MFFQLRFWCHSKLWGGWLNRAALSPGWWWLLQPPLHSWVSVNVVDALCVPSLPLLAWLFFKKSANTLKDSLLAWRHFCTGLWRQPWVHIFDFSTSKMYDFQEIVSCLTEKEMAPHSSTLAWKIPSMEEPGRLKSMGSLRVVHDWATSLSLSCFGEGNGNPLQCSCLENPRDGGAWWAAVYGVTQSRTWLKWLSIA